MSTRQSTLRYPAETPRTHTHLHLLMDSTPRANRTGNAIFLPHPFLQMQAEHTENQIKKEFEVLRQFLKEEEEARLGVLKAEVEHKTAMINQSIEEMKSELGILTNSIYAAEQDMRLSDVPFLQVG